LLSKAQETLFELAGSLSKYAIGKPPLTDELIDQAVEESIVENYLRKLADSE
jgi:hypothetical protein